MNNTPKESPKQLSFADIPKTDRLPAPVRASEKWDFPLQYHIMDDGSYYYSAHDWLRALLGDDENIGQIWTDFKRNSAKNQYMDSIQTLKYLSSDNKKYNRDFVTDTVLYLVSQYLRNKSDRPLLHTLRDFIAQSTSTMDDLLRHPEKMLSVAQSRMLQDIERHDKAGLGNRPEIILLKSKLEATQTLAELKSSITKILAMTSKDWQNFHSAEIQALLGSTIAQLKKARDVKTSARDSLNAFELNSLVYAERQTMAILSIQGTIDPQKLIDTVHLIFTPIGENLRALLETIGIDVLTGKPLLGSGE